MKKKRIIFMGTPDISAAYLDSLISNDYNIIAVYSQPPREKDRGLNIKISPVQELALNNKLAIYNPIKFDKNEIYNFKKLKPDLVIVMAYGLLLPVAILKIPFYGCVNIHVSLLPRWRGAAPIEYAIMNGDKETGITIFKLEEKLDSGPIISQSKIIIDDDITKQKLINKLNTIGIKLLLTSLPNMFTNKDIYEKQDEDLSTYANKITSLTTKIDFNKNVNEVFNKIKAFSPKPAAWFIYNNERIKIIEASIVLGDYSPSTIINNKFNIGCHGGKICPILIQREGKKPMMIENFLRGFNFNIGQKVNV
jgi:methionyl-tRNA formyltransferase